MNHLLLSVTGLSSLLACPPAGSPTPQAAPKTVSVRESRETGVYCLPQREQVIT
jgi:hypothetical protein